VWVAVRVTGCYGAVGETGGSKVVGVVASVGTVHVVVVGLLESAGRGASVDGGFVNAAEGLVCGDALTDVEGVEAQVAGVVVREQSAVDGKLGVLCGDAETGLDSFGEA
jgi:hypothetical protein